MNLMETKSIGRKIAEARKNSHLSQAKLSEELFISPQAVGKWERGESMPDIISLNKLAKILKVDLNYFSEDFDSTPQNNTKPTAEEKAINNTFDFSGGIWEDADFSGLKNLHQQFREANLKNCQFIGTTLSPLHLKDNQIIQCDFTKSDWQQSKVERSSLTKNTFEQTNFSKASFLKSYIKNGSMVSANFSEATFDHCHLQQLKCKHAQWRKTKFTQTSFEQMTFVGQFEDCAFDGCGFKKVTFENATLVNTFFKNNRKLKDVRFVNCKADALTCAFLKNEGVKLDGIEVVEE